jgi:hypothetical protein
MSMFKGAKRCYWVVFVWAIEVLTDFDLLYKKYDFGLDAMNNLWKSKSSDSVLSLLYFGWKKYKGSGTSHKVRT